MTVPDLIPLGWWCLVAGVALGLAAAALHVAEVRAVNADSAPVPDPAVWLPCHSPECAHLTQPHQPTPTGPVCRVCGTIKDGAAT